tara:strand:- start:441 stop:1019 length:579 start_codon:yes stop_codon:yes gene_type:complete
MGMTTETLIDLYIRSVAAFGEVLAKVPVGSWDLPTPCSDWNAQTLVVHVVSGEIQVANMIEKEAFLEPDLSANILGPDPMSTWRGTALRAINLVQQTNIDSQLPHPTMQLTLDQLLGARITDNIVHAWDLSQSIANRYDIDSEIAQWALDYWLELYDFLENSDHYAPPQNPTDQTPATRLLSLLGRKVTQKP